MGLKVINPLIKAVAKKVYVAPKMEVRTLESLGLKMEQLKGDIFQNNSIETNLECFENLLKQLFGNNSSLILKYKDAHKINPELSNILLLKGDEFRTALQHYRLIPCGQNKGIMYKKMLNSKGITQKVPVEVNIETSGMYGVNIRYKIKHKDKYIG